MTHGKYPITPSQLFMIDFLVIGAPAFGFKLIANHEQVNWEKGVFTNVP